MGVAYRAWDTERGLPVVVKIPKKTLLEDPKFAERFDREIRMVQGILHPRVVPIVDVGEHEGVPYVAMRFLPGGSLANRRRRNAEGLPTANPPGMLHLWLPQIAEALDHVHGLGIVHRDVKPENIFFDARWGAFLGDFGIAKVVAESEGFSRDQALTATSMAIGTQQYMAPEQFQPKADVDGRTDQYALAVTVYEVLSGERPFRGETSNLIVEIMTTPAPSLAVRQPKLPRSLVAAVQRGLSKQPEERFGSCQEFVDAVLKDVGQLPDDPDIARLMCPRCGKILKLRSDAAGRKGNCPKCSVQMVVARDLESLWVVGEDGGQTAFGAGSESGSGSKSSGVFEAITGSGSLGGMVAGRRLVLDLFALLAGVIGIGATATIVARVYPQPQPIAQGDDGIQTPGDTEPSVVELSGELVEPPPAEPPPAAIPPEVVVPDPLDEARAALERDPQDRVAHGVVGRALCFGQDRWDEGLGHLAQCDTPAIATIAQNEIDAWARAAEARSGALLMIAKAWWDLAQGGFLRKVDSEAVGRHAVDLYEHIVANLSQEHDVVTANEWLDRDDAFRIAVNNVRPRPVPASAPRADLVTQPSLVNSIGVELKLIPAGTFMMGSNDGRSDEKPAHEVRITKPFYLGVYEVTNAQWKAVMGTMPSKRTDADRPVETVSWNDAVEFCKKLSGMPEEQKAGRVYRLPTEAEWEYACRAGTTTKWASGDDETTLGDFAWFAGNSGRETHPVGGKRPNAWGIHDMHGNVWEWCSDWYGAYAPHQVADPTGPAGGSYRVRRGGSWYNTARLFCPSANRNGDVPSLRGDGLGFRLALSPPESTPLEAGDQAATEHGGSKAEPATDRANPSAAAMPTEPERAETLAQPPITNSIGIKLTLIPAGTFMMGSEDGSDDEKPVHEVRITKPFYLGVTEVTNAQWRTVIGSAPPSTWKDDALPVETVSWNDAVEFCKKLSDMPEERQDGRVYRLPTEAEWEYACRAGTTTKWASGDDEKTLGDMGWFSGNMRPVPRPVGQKRPNAWGLHDMHGNVSEWCSDWYGPYAAEAVADPTGPAAGPLRVHRGGVWWGNARSCRSANRSVDDPSYRNNNLGFRLALSPSESTPPEAGGQAAMKPGGSKAEPATDRAIPSAAAMPTEAERAETLARPPITNSIGMKLKLIPAGTFMMGSNDGDPDEMPVHEVTITRPFHLGVYEVTNAQWQAVMGKVPSVWRDDNRPVEQVNWTDASEFCRALTALPAERAAGRVYRLPTEAEWEYACRAGTRSEYSFGDNRSLLPDHGWFSRNSDGQTQPVGRKKPNPWGLYDMHGNVWEWCADGYGPFSDGVATDPTGLPTAAVRVYRGGNWGYMARESRSAKRKSINPEHRDHYHGFRVAMDEHQ